MLENGFGFGCGGGGGCCFSGVDVDEGGDVDEGEGDCIVADETPKSEFIVAIGITDSTLAAAVCGDRFLAILASRSSRE